MTAPEPSLATKRRALFQHLLQRHAIAQEKVALDYYGLTFNEAQALHLEIRPHTHTDGKD